MEHSLIYLWVDICDFIHSIGMHDLIELGLFLCWAGLLLFPVKTGHIISYLTYCLTIVSLGLIIFYVVPMKYTKTPGNYNIFLKSSLLMFAVASIRWFHQTQVLKAKLLPIERVQDGEETN